YRSVWRVPGTESLPGERLTAAVPARAVAVHPGAAQQLGSHEAVEVAVENALDVAHLEVRAVVLDHRVGVEDVGPDLGAPGHVLRLALLARELLAAPLLLELEQARLEHRHGGGLVGGLRALVLALHHDACGPVRDSDRRVGLVHVLAAGP